MNESLSMLLGRYILLNLKSLQGIAEYKVWFVILGD